MLERIKNIKKKIVKWRRLFKFLAIIGKIWHIVIAIAGPAMSIFLLVDDIINKDNPYKKKPIEPIGVRYE